MPIGEDKKIVEQNNYNNQYLVTIRKQLDKIENMLKNTIENPSKIQEKPLLNLLETRKGLSLPKKEV